MDIEQALAQLESSRRQVVDPAHPLEFIADEHARFRTCCDMLHHLAESPVSVDAAGMASAMLRYMEEALPLHVADEEEDLFPTLRRACRIDDNAGYVLDLLSLEHGDDIEYCQSLRSPLRRIAGGRDPDDRHRFSHYARAFALLQRRHLEWENVLVLPLARKRLDEQAMMEMGQSMAARRDV